VQLYLTRQENTLLLSPSEDLIERALAARASGHSVLHDEAFAADLGRLTKDTTFALCAHAGRLLSVAEPFLGEQERAELAPYSPLLTRTVVALQGQHSNTRLGFALALHGLPKVDGLVAQLLSQQRDAPTVVHDGLQAHFERLAAASDGGASRAPSRASSCRCCATTRAP
jgi:hypothetical protein